jgi:nitroreductase
MHKPAPTDVPIHELLRDRWSPRAFSDRAVEGDKLRRLFEAFRWAPSSYNEQPWALIVASKEDRAEFDKLLGCLVEFNRSWAKAAAVLILTVARRVLERNGQPNHHAAHDVGQAMAMLTIQAQAEGLSVHQMAGILPDEARKVYGVPADWDVLTGVAIGYGGDAAVLPEQLRDRELAPRSRKPVSSIVFTSTWNKSWGVAREA